MGCGASSPEGDAKPVEKPPTPNMPPGGKTGINGTPATASATATLKAAAAATAAAQAGKASQAAGKNDKGATSRSHKEVPLDRLTPGAASVLANTPSKKFQFPSETPPFKAAEDKSSQGAAKSTPQQAAPLASVPDILQPQPGAPVDVTQRGVSLKFLAHMVASGAVDATLSMHQVMEAYVKPRTKAHNCCLFDLVPKESTGKPSFYVSYASTHRLGELLRLLQEHFEVESQPDVMLWLEVMAVNPQEGRAKLLNGDLDRVLMDTQKLVFCIDERCGSLSDAWCLYEVLQANAARGETSLVVLMPMIDATELKNAFRALHIGKATTADPADQARILQLMGGESAADYLNGQIREAIVGCALHEAEHTTATDGAWAAVLNKASELALANSKFVEAEIMGRHALDTRRKVLGPNHPLTMRSIINLAMVLTERGKLGENGRHAEAEGLYRQILETKTAVLTAEHPETISWQQKLATCIDAQGRRRDAEPMYREVLAQRTKLLGAEHPDTLAAIGNLAACIKALGAEEDGAQKVAMAEALYRQALEAYTRVLGEEHPDTIHAYNNLAICLDDQGRRSEAEPMFFKVLEQRTRLLGPDHATTADAMYNLGGLLEAEGEYDEALRMYESAKEVYNKNYGPDHPETEDAGSRALAMQELIGYERSHAAARQSQ